MCRSCGATISLHVTQGLGTVILPNKSNLGVSRTAISVIVLHEQGCVGLRLVPYQEKRELSSACFFVANFGSCAWLQWRTIPMGLFSR